MSASAFQIIGYERKPMSTIEVEFIWQDLIAFDKFSSKSKI